METLALLMVVVIARLIGAAIQARKPVVTTVFAKRETTLCQRCVYAHIAQGYKSREKLTYCTYAGMPRLMRFAVSECSMFCDRASAWKLTRIAGFGLALEEPEMADKQ